MSESLLEKARRLQVIAGEARAVLNARHDAKRLANRVTDLQTALTTTRLAAQTWRACAEANVPGLPVPHGGGLTQALTELRRQLDTGDPPPDTDFDAVKHGLAALANRTHEAIAQAWHSFAQSTANSAGLGSSRMLPPTTRHTLDSTITSVDQAIAATPTNPSQVAAFVRHVTTLKQQIDAARVQDLPAPLVPVFDKLGGEGLPLGELTAEQLRLLHEGGFADNLVVRWTT
jgi:hypothetical protein